MALSTQNISRSKSTSAPKVVSKKQARAIWLNAQKLTQATPFGSGPSAVKRATTQLGYVQIDTINVIERCHHHILFNRIPTYTRANLTDAQTTDKSVFEYWTHALSFVPTDDFKFFVSDMKRNRKNPNGWSASVSDVELRRILKRVKTQGPLAISDIKDDDLVEKTHAWGSKKPSKRALQAGFYNGQLAISRRDGMLKTYELLERHFGWEKFPKAATPTQCLQYLIDRAVRAQGFVSLDSICHLTPKLKPAINALIEKEVRAKRLAPIRVDDVVTQFWAKPETLDTEHMEATLTHILSPFDPLIIQRKRTSAIFDYDHLFEAYVPAKKRKMGYFTLPIIIGDEIVAAIDFKTDRQAEKLLIQSWHWVGIGTPSTHKHLIETALDNFESFQLGRN